MALILEFRNDPARRRARPAAASEPATAKIFLFPGVRVSYWEDEIELSDDLPPAPQTSTRKSKSPRRR